MPPPVSGTLRAVRVGVLTVVAVGLALFSHTLSGGHAPHPLALAAITALVVAPVHRLTRAPSGFVAAAVLLGLSQEAFHLLAEAFPAHHQEAGGAAFSPSAMAVAHLVATLSAAAIVSYSDAVLWALWRWVTRRVPPRPTPAEPPKVAALRVWFSRAVPVAPPGSGLGTRRGPPAAFALMVPH